MNVEILAFTTKYGDDWDKEYSRKYPLNCLEDMEEIADRSHSVIYLTMWQMRQFRTLMSRHPGVNCFHDPITDAPVYYFSGMPVRIKR